MIGGIIATYHFKSHYTVCMHFQFVGRTTEACSGAAKEILTESSNLNSTERTEKTFSICWHKTPKREREREREKERDYRRNLVCMARDDTTNI